MLKCGLGSNLLLAEVDRSCTT